MSGAAPHQGPDSGQSSAPGSNCVALTGSLTMNSVGPWFKQLSRMPSDQTVILDFSKVTEADSSAIAMISAFKRERAERSGGVVLVNVPPSLKVVADIYDAADVLTQS